jgi:ATP-dependent DNA ligase
VAYVPPMEPCLAEEAPEGTNWIHELKYDGYRTQLAIRPGGLRAYTRRGHDWSELYRPLIEAARALNCDSALIEGEVIVQDRKGLSDFHTLGSKLNQLVVFGLG